MFGDTMLANGTVYPEATVEARRYRLRILNACKARFLNLQLYVDDGTPDGITLDAHGTFAPTNAKGPDFLVIGTEGGFLPKPVTCPVQRPLRPAGLTWQTTGSLITGPAERWDARRLQRMSVVNPGQEAHPVQRRPGAVPDRATRERLLPGRPGQPDHSPTPGSGPTPARSCGSRSWRQLAPIRRWLCHLTLPRPHGTEADAGIDTFLVTRFPDTDGGTATTTLPSTSTSCQTGS